MPSVASLSVDGRSFDVLERKKLFQPGNTIEVLLVEGRGLRDGAVCDVAFHAPADETGLANVPVRLAEWDHPNTRRVLKFIAGRFIREDDPPRVLERYLSFISAWQAPSRIIANFPEGLIVEVDTPDGDDVRDGYVVSMQGLLNASPVFLCSHSGRCRFWLPEMHPAHIYLDIGGNLVRTVLSAPQEVPATGARLQSSADDPLFLDALDRLGMGASPSFAELAGGLCRKTAELVSGDDVHRVRGCVRLPNDGIAFFVDLPGPVLSDPQFEIRAFGNEGHADIAVTACETESLGDGATRTQFIIEATDLILNGCYHLSWNHSGERYSAWVRETEATERSAENLAREFYPVTFVDQGLFTRVLHPIAAAPVVPAIASLVHKAEFGESIEPQVEILVFAQRDIEALHRTMIGLSLTLGNVTCEITICCFDRSLVAPLTEHARSWATLFGISLRLACFGSGVSEALAAQYSFGRQLPRVLCRAGTVPRQSGWLSSALVRARKGRTGLLLGWSASQDVNEAETVEQLFEKFHPLQMEGIDHFALGAALVTTRLDAAIAEAIKVFTLEAYILALALRADGQGEVVFSTEMGFGNCGSEDQHDRFEEIVDLYGLQKLYESVSSSKHKLIRMRRRAGA
ncbi:hypothetical protein [Microvirga flavescens]|uniref:hypothetical protein n=1 Tax=Microvirga flavescens TaxID=2249811 RepID=UPI0013006FFE|nr:hypothetical protein [Microvirga flavescens]